MPDPTLHPGFVDLQVNGYLGVDFSSPNLTEDDAQRAIHALLARGTAAFLPTVITNAPEVYARNLPLLAAMSRRKEFQGRLLGLHLEGPFLSSQPGAVGAHNPAWIHPTDLDYLKRLLDWSEGHVRLLTVAAGEPGVERLIRFAADQGIVVSLGHQLADQAALERAVQAGARVLTHLGNGVPNTLPRHDNPIWHGLACDALHAMLIADGHHLPAHVLRVMLRAKTLERCIVVSDAAPLAGLPPGRYTTLGNQVVLEPSGLLHNPIKACLVGSSATMLDCMNHLARLGWLTLEEMLALGLHNPLGLLRMTADDLPRVGGVVFHDNQFHHRKANQHGSEE